MSQPTKTQRAVLRFIASEIARRGVAPTIREIQARFRWSSPYAAQRHIAALERRGLLTHQPGLARTWRPTSRRGIPLVSLSQCGIESDNIV